MRAGPHPAPALLPPMPRARPVGTMPPTHGCRDERARAPVNDRRALLSRGPAGWAGRLRIIRSNASRRPEPGRSRCRPDSNRVPSDLPPPAMGRHIPVAHRATAAHRQLRTARPALRPTAGRMCSAPPAHLALPSRSGPRARPATATALARSPPAPPDTQRHPAADRPTPARTSRVRSVIDRRRSPARTDHPLPARTYGPSDLPPSDRRTSARPLLRPVRRVAGRGSPLSLPCW